MGFSIYYAAKRGTPLAGIEVQRIDAIVQSFDVAAEIEHGWHDNASDGLASLWLGCLLSSPFRLFARSA